MHYDRIKQKQSKIAIIGDFILDHYIIGVSERISPEAPVPIVLCKNETENLGGAGNVVANLINMGVTVYPFGTIGSDSEGNRLKTLLSDIGGYTDFIYMSRNNHTTLKTRIIADTQQVVRIDWDASELSLIEEEKIHMDFFSNIPKLDAIIISDYDKGFCTDTLLEKLYTYSRENHIPVYIDPKGINYSKYSGAKCITPNTKEAQAVIPFPLNNDASFINGANYLIKKHNFFSCIITRGKDGMVYCDNENELIITSKAKEVYDVSGAGDAVIAAYTAADIAGFTTQSALEFANKTAGIVVGHVGTAPISVKELMNL